MVEDGDIFFEGGEHSCVEKFGGVYDDELGRAKHHTEMVGEQVSAKFVGQFFAFAQLVRGGNKLGVARK